MKDSGDRGGQRQIFPLSVKVPGPVFMDHLLVNSFVCPTYCFFWPQFDQNWTSLFRIHKLYSFWPVLAINLKLNAFQIKCNFDWPLKKKKYILRWMSVFALGDLEWPFKCAVQIWSSFECPLTKQTFSRCLIGVLLYIVPYYIKHWKCHCMWTFITWFFFLLKFLHGVWLILVSISDNVCLHPAYVRLIVSLLNLLSGCFSYLCLLN